jgi:hypothetical protein
MHWIERPQSSVVVVLHLFKQARALLGAQQEPSGMHTSNGFGEQKPSPNSPQVTSWPQLLVV